jgi:hypothetical protein
MVSFILEMEVLVVFLKFKLYYTDPPMRGRQSFNPFKKLGFVWLEDGILKITDFGEHFLSEEYDLSEIFFRSFIKWQLPNPDNTGYKLRDGHDIKPFIGTLHLIKTVNSKWETLGNNPVGLSKKEFLLFAGLKDCLPLIGGSV